MAKVDLRLDWCSHAAAKYAVEHWHYSKTMPCGKNIYVGVWENKTFIGVVVFGTGAAPQASSPYKLKRQQVCELVRVSLREHISPVSKVVAVALRFLKKKCPLLRIVISYADPEQDHRGVIYQAGNWVYTGPTGPCVHFVNSKTGKRIHSKTLKTGRRGYATQLLASGAVTQIKLWKHKYLYPLDKAMKEQIEPLRQPYPKRAGSETGDTSDDQSEEGGSTPTPALQLKT